MKNIKISESPEKWVILKISNEVYKVFGSWYDRWKINSGIEKVEQDEDFYYFFGYSGSCYKCHKKGYGTASFYTTNILYDILKKGDGSFELLKDDEWTNELNII